MVRAVGCWRAAGWLKVDFPIMEIPFVQWSENVDEDDDLGDIWPDWAPIDADAFPGDIDDRHPDQNVINFVPNWSTVANTTYAHGTWGTANTRGCGDRRGKVGRLGIYTGNWVGNWQQKDEREHMMKDAKSNPCHILCFQECTADLRRYLELPAAQPAEGSKKRFDKESTLLVVQGPEEDGLAIVVRESVVQGIRLQWYYRSDDGTYKKEGTKRARSGIMMAKAKMRHYRLRGRGGKETDEITICNAHLHSATARRVIRKGSEAYKSFFDELAKACQRFEPRILCGDFNMALYTVVPELRGNGAVTTGIGVGSDALN